VTIALLTNSNDSELLYRDLFSELLAEHAGVEMPAPLQPPAQPVPAGTPDVIGSYESTLMRYQVHERAGELMLTARPSGVLATSLGTEQIEAPLVPFATDVYLTQVPGRPGWLPVVFYRLADGTRYLQVGDQAAPRSDRPAVP
jgi:hypothetical protein